jgi:hypothetical protein
LATAFAGQAHGQIIEQQSSDPQQAMGLGVVDTYDSFCPDTASTRKMLTHISDVVSATVDFKVVSAKFEEVVAEATAMGEDKWCVRRTSTTCSIAQKNQLRRKGPSLVIWGMPMNAVVRSMI